MRLTSSIGGCFLLAVLIVADVTAERVIHFPDRSVGTVYGRPASSEGFGFSKSGTNLYEGWVEVAAAAGKVALRDNHAIKVKLNRDGVANLDWVSKLPEDSVEVLEASYVPLDDDGLAQLTRLRGLRSLDLSGTELSPSAAESLAKFQHLEHLSLNYVKLDDHVAATIVALPELETVGLFATGITDVGLKTLAGSSSLKAVFVGKNRITDEGVAELCKLPDLRALNLYAGDPEFRGDEPNPLITDLVAGSLAPSLENLIITGASFTDDGFAQLAARLPHLRVLAIEHTQVTPQGLVHLSKLSELEQLSLPEAALVDTAADHLATLTGLRVLNGEIQFSDAGLAKIAALTNLETLRLNDHLITDASIPVLKGMQALKELSLQHTRITDEGFAQLAGAPSLERIQITRNRMTSRCIETLATMPRLKQVGLMDVDARVDGESAWKGLEGLSFLDDELWLCFCPSLSAEDFEKLSRFSNLKQLRVEGAGRSYASRPATDVDIAHLAGLEKLEYLDLGSTVTTDRGLALLAKLPRLEQLVLSCVATDAGLRSLAVAPALKYLTIRSPDITDVGVERLRAENPTILSARREEMELDSVPVSRVASDRFWRNRTEEERKELNALEGKPAPPLTVTKWLNASEDQTLEDFHGKVVMIDFWGKWCGPCVSQLPEVRRLNQKYKERGLVVIGLHSTDESESAPNFVESNNIDWPIALDDDNQSKTVFGVQGWPSYFLIDRRGILRMADIYDGDREAAIQALLEESE